MTLSEKAAYLKGLMDGLKLDTEKNEGKMIAAIVDMLEDVSYAISDIEDNAQAVSDELDESEASPDVMEEIVFDDGEDQEDDDDFDFGDEALYEVKCPTCGEVITIDPRLFNGDQDEMLSYVDWLEPDLVFILNTTSSLRVDELFPYLPTARADALATKRLEREQGVAHVW